MKEADLTLWWPFSLDRNLGALTFFGTLLSSEFKC